MPSGWRRSRTKDYLFPLRWPLYAVAGQPRVRADHCADLPPSARRPRHDPRSGAGDRVPVAARRLRVALALNAARVALAIQLQTRRIFWMLDFMATVYAVWALAEGARGTVRRRAIAAGDHRARARRRAAPT